MLYEAGQGWPRDAAKAFYWYKTAAAGGVADAQVNLGYLYAQGRGTPKDLIESLAWYTIAADLGHPVAIENIALIESALDPAEISLARNRATELNRRANISNVVQEIELPDSTQPQLTVDAK